MIVTAALPWWGERPEDLDACIRGLAGVADRVIALDGAYARYPGATASSAPAEADAIRKAAKDVGLDCLILTPDKVWAGQVEKRSHLLAAASVGSDWIATVDADHVVTANREHVRYVLERVREDVLEVPYRTPLNPARGIKDAAVGKWHIDQAEGVQFIPHLWRVLPGLRVERYHWWYSAMKPLGRVWLWGGDGRYPGTYHGRMDEYEVEHRTLFRTKEQIRASRAFLNDRETVVKETGQEDDLPTLPRPKFSYEMVPW